MLEQQSNEINHLRTDYYTKSTEINDKLEMLNSRLGDTEAQLMRIHEQLGEGKQPTPDSSGISTITPEARLIYESAYRNYIKGDYQEAISGYEDYLKIQPDSPLSPNAVYWIGECYAAMGKSQEAVNKFQELLTKYPNSNKRPTALYKMGVIYEEAGDKKTSAYYYNKVINDYPNSPEATLAQDRLN
jgi:tol-pal system protein YbgF